MKYTYFFLAGLMLSSVCSAHKVSQTHQPHYKPGADVIFSHNYDGSSEVHDFEYLDLQFSSQSLAEGESMKISLNPSSSLDVIEGLKFEALPVNDTARLPITLNASNEGRHYLGIQVEILDSQGNRSFRVFELPIQVGDKVATRKRSQQKLTKTANGRKIAILKSREKVESQ